MRPTRFLAAFLATVMFSAMLSGCDNPRTQANIAQALNDAANEISGLKDDIAALQTEIDSMRTVLIKQDSTISRIAAVNNIPIVR